MIGTNMPVEPVERIDPCRLDDPGEEIVDVIADLSAAATTLGLRLHSNGQDDSLRQVF